MSQPESVFLRLSQNASAQYCLYHRPSFDGGLHQYNILEICHVMIMQQQYKDVSVIGNNNDFAFCIFRGTTQELLDNDAICFFV